MNVDSAVTTLADILTTPDSDDVRLEELSARAAEENTEASATVAFPFEAGVDAEQVTVTGGEYVDGDITVDIAITVTDDTDAPETVDDAEAAESEDHAGTSETLAEEADDDGATDDETPTYKDPERLREVYAEYDSFSEMQEALDVDVTAQTVRRNMMKEGIHTLDTTDDSGTDADGAADGTTDKADADTDQRAADDGAKQVSGGNDADTADGETADGMTDGAGNTPTADEEFSDVDLPNGLKPADVRDAVAESSSLHGVQMALGIEIAEARSLLQELEVLEYVGGRIAEHEVDPVEIEERIQGSLRARADGGDGT